MQPLNTMVRPRSASCIGWSPWRDRSMIDRRWCPSASGPEDHTPDAVGSPVGHRRRHRRHGADVGRPPVEPELAAEAAHGGSCRGSSGDGGSCAATGPARGIRASGVDSLSGRTPPGQAACPGRPDSIRSSPGWSAGPDGRRDGSGLASHAVSASVLRGANDAALPPRRCLHRGPVPGQPGGGRPPRRARARGVDGRGGGRGQRVRDRVRPPHRGAARAPRPALVHPDERGRPLRPRHPRDGARAVGDGGGRRAADVRHPVGRPRCEARRRR